MKQPEDQWNAVDQYLVEKLVQPDAALNDALAENTRAGLPQIDVSPTQGKLLYLMALMLGARRVLEIGTLGGYSTIWLARALPSDGLLVTLEAESSHAAVARTNVQRAGLSQLVRIHEGKALETLPGIKATYPEPFDLVFIDADKPSTAEYFNWGVSLSRPGGIIIADNVVRKGELVNAASTDERVQGMRRFVEMVAKDSRVSATALQTVGSKGHDGFVVARVNQVE